MQRAIAEGGEGAAGKLEVQRRCFPRHAWTREQALTSSSNLRSWIIFAIAFCLMHLALSIYLSAYSFFVFLCSTTLTCEGSESPAR